MFSPFYPFSAFFFCRTPCGVAALRAECGGSGLSVNPSGTSCHLPHRGRHPHPGSFCDKRNRKTIALRALDLYNCKKNVGEGLAPPALECAASMLRSGAWWQTSCLPPRHLITNHLNTSFPHRIHSGRVSAFMHSS